MTMTDPIADFLTRIRNANATRKPSTDMPASRMKVGMAEILKEEGFISSYEVIEKKPQSELRIELKYGQNGERVIRDIRRISKPGCRVYSKATDIPTVLKGMGITVLSTPAGIISDRTARKQNVGGEVLCTVY